MNDESQQIQVKAKGEIIVMTKRMTNVSKIDLEFSESPEEPLGIERHSQIHHQTAQSIC